MFLRFTGESQCDGSLRKKPYLGLRLPLDFKHLDGLTPPTQAPRRPQTQRGIFVNRMTPELIDCLVRLLRLLDHPEDAPVMSPLLQKEILYRLLKHDHANLLQRLAQRHSQVDRIRSTVIWLNKHFAERFSLSGLARRANMSPSGLLQHFKAATNMSPLQFQKKLRLKEARRLMIAESVGVATAAYRVGYSSPSQFSREYKRMFGGPPNRDVEQARDKLQPLDVFLALRERTAESE